MVKKRKWDHDILKGTPLYSNCDTSVNWVLRNGPYNYYNKCSPAFVAVDRMLSDITFDFGTDPVSRARKKKFAMAKLDIIWKGYLELGQRWPYTAEDWVRWLRAKKNDLSIDPCNAYAWKDTFFGWYYTKGALLSRMHNAAQALKKVSVCPECGWATPLQCAGTIFWGSTRRSIS